MIINRKSTFFLGIFIFTIPFLGFPSTWKAVFTVISGILLVILSLKLNIPRKNIRRVHKEKVTPVFVESVPIVYPKNDTIEKITQTQVMDVKPVARKPRVTKKSNGPVI